MTLGTHGSTYGGNPLAMAVGNAVLDQVLAEGFLDHVNKVAGRLAQRLAEVKDRHPAIIAEVRGQGLLMGLKANVPAGDLVVAMREEGLLAPGAGDNVVRLLPPLNVSEEEAIQAADRIEAACVRLEKSFAPARGAAE